MADSTLPDPGAQPLDGLASSERDQSATSLRKFRFDPDTLRGNYHWVTVTANDENGHTSLFVIALDSEQDEAGGIDYQAFRYRAHGTPGQTEVIVALLPRAPMRALVRAVLDAESPGITLSVTACA